MKEFEDRLSKFAAMSLFGACSRVEVGTELLPDSLRADTLLIPNAPLPLIAGAELLTRLTHDARCLIESFSGTLHSVRLEGNLTKLRLALHRAHQDKLGVPQPKGVLWIIVSYWPHTAISEVIGEEGETLEQGLHRWNGLPRETIYIVNTSMLEEREDTLFFRLLGKGETRKKAVMHVFHEHIEPYVTILNNFDMRFQQMVQANQHLRLDDDTRNDLLELRDTREEVLLSLGHKEGEKAARIKIAKRLLHEGMAIDKIADLTELSPSEIQTLQ